MKKILLTLAAIMAMVSCKNENPFLAEWDTPYGIPDFNAVEECHYLPAVEAGIAQQQTEIDAIIANTEAPTFENVVAAYEKMLAVGGQVVILGKRGHAEVVGLSGQVDDNVIVVECEEDLTQVDFSRPIFFLSQTTQSIALFWQLAEVMKSRLEDESMLTVDDTICRRVSNREKALSEFARRFDVVIFVCGKKSSNGKVLFDVCRRANSRSYNVEEESELQPQWFEGCQSVGICGATSTPTWLMKRVAEAIETRIV